MMSLKHMLRATSVLTLLCLGSVAAVGSDASVAHAEVAPASTRLLSFAKEVDLARPSQGGYGRLTATLFLFERGLQVAVFTSNLEEKHRSDTDAERSRWRKLWRVEAWRRVGADGEKLVRVLEAAPETNLAELTIIAKDFDREWRERGRDANRTDDQQSQRLW